MKKLRRVLKIGWTLNRIFLQSAIVVGLLAFDPICYSAAQADAYGSSSPDHNKREFILKLGFDMPGDIYWSGTHYYRKYNPYSGYYTWPSEGISESLDVKSGISLSGEMVFYINDKFGLGFGLTYQAERELDTTVGGKFQFIPIYGLAKIRFPAETVTPYILGQAGYNFLEGDDKFTFGGDLEGGAYVGIGPGLKFNNGFLLELLYTINFGYFEYTTYGHSYEIYVRYQKVGLGIGYAF
ncbi:MAG: hypothetical protein ABII27_08790 [bacterium]